MKKVLLTLTIAIALVAFLGGLTAVRAQDDEICVTEIRCVEYDPTAIPVMYTVDLIYGGAPVTVTMEDLTVDPGNAAGLGYLDSLCRWDWDFIDGTLEFELGVLQLTNVTRVVR
jgi:hypothetical protein